MPGADNEVGGGIPVEEERREEEDSADSHGHRIQVEFEQPEQIEQAVDTGETIESD